LRGSFPNSSRADDVHIDHASPLSNASFGEGDHGPVARGSFAVVAPGDKLGSTAAAVDDPTTQQLAAQACTSLEQLCATSCCSNVRHSEARSQQLGAGSAAARSGVR
jgi:hypothetical protein